MTRFFAFLRHSGLWAPILVLILHKMLHVKGWHTEIDWLHHYCGGLSFTWFVWKSLPLAARWTGALTPCGHLAAAFSGGCTAALLWEIGEFSSDLFLHTAIQESLNETMMDIVNGFLGTITIVAIQAFLAARFSSKSQGCEITSSQ